MVKVLVNLNAQHPFVALQTYYALIDICRAEKWHHKMYALTCCTSRPRAQTSVEIRTRASPPLFQHHTRAQFAAEEAAWHNMQLHKSEQASSQVRQSLDKPAEPTAAEYCSSQLSLLHQSTAHPAQTHASHMCIFVLPGACCSSRAAAAAGSHKTHLKLCMMASRSICGMSPCMDATVKLFCCIFSVSQSTFRFVLQKMTACVMVRVSYRSHSVSNFHSSFSTATKNCLMPCSVGGHLTAAV